MNKTEIFEDPIYNECWTLLFLGCSYSRREHDTEDDEDVRLDDKPPKVTYNYYCGSCGCKYLLNLIQDAVAAPAASTIRMGDR